MRGVPWGPTPSLVLARILLTLCSQAARPQPRACVLTLVLHISALSTVVQPHLICEWKVWGDFETFVTVRAFV